MNISGKYHLSLGTFNLKRTYNAHFQVHTYIQDFLHALVVKKKKYCLCLNTCIQVHSLVPVSLSPLKAQSALIGISALSLQPWNDCNGEQSPPGMTFLCRPQQKLASPWFLCQKVFGIFSLDCELLWKISSVANKPFKNVHVLLSKVMFTNGHHFIDF